MSEVTTDSKLVLVTGGTGFIAGHIIKQLLTKGYRVRTTVRSVADMDSYYYLHRLPNAVNLDVQQADLVVKESWPPIFEGVDYVMHVASPYILKPDDPQNTLMEPAVTGTSNILDMCQTTPSVQKLIFTSCACALTDEFDPSREYSEKDWNDTSSLERNSYAFSKVSAERLVTEFCARKECTFKLATIVPATVIGPHIGSKINVSNRQILSFLGKYHNMIIPNLFYSISDVQDVSTAHILAMETPRITGRFCLCQPPMKLSAILQTIHENCRDIALPTKQSLDFTVKLAMSRDNTFRGEFIRYNLSRPANIKTYRARDVGMSCRPVVQTIMDMVRSFQAADLIDVPRSELDGSAGTGWGVSCTIS